MRLSTVAAVALLTACSGAASDRAASAAETADSPTISSASGEPIVVELFQSQGCSSCPPANAVLNAIADDPALVPLSFSVTYWDRFGWKDTFAEPAFTARQWDYANAAGRRNVATPQMIVAGRYAINGGDRKTVHATIAKARRNGAGPRITIAAGKATVAAAKDATPATVWLVRYDPRVHQVSIRAGENGGRTLPHKNIVRELTALGSWTGTAKSYAIPIAPTPAYRSAVIVQQGKGGPIIAARRL